ncbi:GNAT family N-acetyltransferase [Actinomadura yumaensis]|uniref:GNAT family N-acetyltransferase n=1 Tax=Actinomadura yumaensis TaxID=111807 RepID=A0ABW2CQ43_9ACTN
MIEVVPATPAHTATVAELLGEMDQFYGASELEPISARLQHINTALFSDPPAGFALLAFEESAAVGIATYSFLWPAVGLTRSLYLKELYVREAHRRSGVGTTLMQALKDIAITHECSRIEWTTDEENLGAQSFYKELGFVRLATKLFYRLSNPAD